MFEQDRFLVRLQQHVIGDANIAVCFLSGSYGRRREDGYSDLDVALVFASDAGRERHWQKRETFVQALNPYVPAKSFDAVHIRPFFHIALYSNGTKADFRFETKASLQPNPWDRDIRIIKDDAGWAADFQSASSQLAPPQPRLTLETLTELDNRFWIMFWDVLRLVLRGDHDKPFPIYLQLLHFHLPPLLDALPPEEPARQALLAANFSADTQATAVHLNTLLNAYLAARAALVRRYHLDFEADGRFESAIKQLVDRKV